jgi:hypothetical protein
MGAFIPKDTQIYDEAWVDLAAAKAALLEEVVEDTFGFYLVGGAIGDNVAFVYRMRQVLANKKTGTGEEIAAMEKVYYYPATDNVSSNKVGTAGTDYYFCGWAKKSADANETTVLINFDGTRHTENI